jgi:hypothetical protein
MGMDQQPARKKRFPSMASVRNPDDAAEMGVGGRRTRNSGPGGNILYPATGHVRPEFRARGLGDT